MLRRLGVKGVEVRKPEQLQSVRALIIPGGESTTMAKLAEYHNLVCSLSLSRKAINLCVLIARGCVWLCLVKIMSKATTELTVVKQVDQFNPHTRIKISPCG